MENEHATDMEARVIARVIGVHIYIYMCTDLLSRNVKLSCSNMGLCCIKGVRALRQVAMKWVHNEIQQVRRLSYCDH